MILPEDKVKNKPGIEVVYRISDRQVGWLYPDGKFLPCVWERAQPEGSRWTREDGFTSTPEFKE